MVSLQEEIQNYKIQNEKLTKECQSLESQMQDVAFSKSNAKSEANQLRESIKMVDEKMQLMIENKLR